MRLSKSFALLSMRTERATDSPTELSRRRSSVDSFVIPRRTRLPSSKQSHSETTDLDVVSSLFGVRGNKHTNIESKPSGGNPDVPTSPRKRRSLFPQASRKENQVPTLLMSPTKAHGEMNSGPLSPTSDGRSLLLRPESQPKSLGESTIPNDIKRTSRKTSSSYASERPGSVRSAKEYNQLARRHGLPPFDYHNFDHSGRWIKTKFGMQRAS